MSVFIKIFPAILKLKMRTKGQTEGQTQPSLPSSPKYTYRSTNIIYFVSSDRTPLIYLCPTTLGSIQNPNTCYMKTSYYYQMA